MLFFDSHCLCLFRSSSLWTWLRRRRPTHFRVPYEWHQLHLSFICSRSMLCHRHPQALHSKLWNLRVYLSSFRYFHRNLRREIIVRIKYNSI
jgi:hypothetical protein